MHSKIGDPKKMQIDAARTPILLKFDAYQVHGIHTRRAKNERSRSKEQLVKGAQIFV